MSNMIGIILIDKQEVVVNFFERSKKAIWKHVVHHIYDLVRPNEIDEVLKEYKTQIIKADAFKVACRGSKDYEIEDIEKEYLTEERERALICTGLLLENINRL